MPGSANQGDGLGREEVPEGMRTPLSPYKIRYCPHFPWDPEVWEIEAQWAHCIRVLRPCRLAGHDMVPGDELRVCDKHHQWLEQIANLMHTAEYEAEQVEGLVSWTDEWFEAVKNRVGPTLWAQFGEIGR